jgi:hypothetical protein
MIQPGFEKPFVNRHFVAHWRAVRLAGHWTDCRHQTGARNAGSKNVKTVKIMVPDAEQARQLLDSIDTSTVVGLRDRDADIRDNLSLRWRGALAQSK